MKLLVLTFLTLIVSQANAALVCNAHLNEEIAVLRSSGASTATYQTKIADYSISVRELGGSGGDVYLTVKGRPGIIEDSAYLLQTTMPSPNKTAYGKSQTFLRVLEGDLVTECSDK